MAKPHIAPCSSFLLLPARWRMAPASGAVLRVFPAIDGNHWRLPAELSIGGGLQVAPVTPAFLAVEGINRTRYIDETTMTASGSTAGAMPACPAARRLHGYITGRSRAFPGRPAVAIPPPPSEIASAVRNRRRHPAGNDAQFSWRFRRKLVWRQQRPGVNGVCCCSTPRWISHRRKP